MNEQARKPVPLVKAYDPPPEPPDVAELPERRVDDGELRAEKALAVELARDAREVVSCGEEIRR